MARLFAVIAQRDRWPPSILGSSHTPKWLRRRTRSTGMAQRYRCRKNSPWGAGRWFYFNRTFHVHCISRWTWPMMICQDTIWTYYHQVATPLLLDHVDRWRGSMSDREPSLCGFHRSFSLVSSRAFLVDAYHGLSMVPIADALVLANWFGYAWPFVQL